MSNKTKKTIIFSPSSGIWGGGQIYIDQLCNYMNTHGAATTLLTSEPRTFSCRTSKMPKVSSKLKRLFATVAVAAKTKKEGYSNVILNDLSSLWLAPVFKFFGFKTVSLLHLYLQNKKVNVLGHSSTEYHVLKMAARFCDRIFSVNKNNQSVFGPSRVTFIGNYVPEWFFSAPLSPSAAKYDFIIVARLAPVKNIPLAIKALRGLIDHTGKQYTMLIVGDGPERESVTRAVSEANLNVNVELLDWTERKDLPSIYDMGKCFVISSIHEGFATTLLEAHARGLPALVTRSAGFCTEFVEGFNGKTGMVFEPESLGRKDFYDQLAALIAGSHTLRERCITKAQGFSEKKVLGPIMAACTGD